tara:strand:- start:833 stop:1198 length:366 start_codon:yes stop_codon:yes gene_type:complete
MENENKQVGIIMSHIIAQLREAIFNGQFDSEHYIIPYGQIIPQQLNVILRNKAISVYYFQDEIGVTVKRIGVPYGKSNDNNNNVIFFKTNDLDRKLSDETMLGYATTITQMIIHHDKCMKA